MGVPSILIVDDDPDMRDCLRDVLELEGYGVVEATDGHEAISSLVHQHSPDVILLDKRMPRMDAQHFLDWLGRHGRFDAVQVVVTSGDSDDSAHPRAAAVLRKPYGMDDLLDLLRRLLQAAPPGVLPETMLAAALAPAK